MKNRTPFVKLFLSFMERSKNWRTLRATCLLLFLCTSFIAYSQITVNLKDLSLRASLKKIEQVSSYKFFYNENLPELNQKVSMNVQNATIEQTMQQLLETMELTYKQEKDNVIVLVRMTQEKQRMIKVSGKVVDMDGEPIIGASVAVKGSINGTITDVNGSFSINNVPESAQLIVTYIGYKPMELAANDKNVVKIALQEDSQMIDEVVVVGYGVQRKRDVTTSISSLKASELAVPVSSIDQAMTGKMAGVQVTQPSGIPGGGMSIKVRGTGSISAGNEPLYVVDGFPMSDGVGDATGMKVNPLSSINMNDVESIEVLKDASAAAIYGSRGSNGVVIITTKKGKDGKPVVKYDGYVGWQKRTKKIKMVGAYDYAKLLYDSRNNAYFDALAAKGLTGSVTDSNDERRTKLGQPLTNEKLNYIIPSEVFPYLESTPGLTDTDWQDEVLRTALTQSHNVSVTGGTKSALYFVSANYMGDKGIVIGSGFQQMGARAKIDATYNKFAFGANISFNHSEYDLVPTEDRYSKETIVSTALGMAPILPVYDENGDYNFKQYIWNHGLPNLINPVALANLRKDNMKRNRMLGTLYAEYEIIKDLKLKSSFGADFNSFRRNVYRPSTLPTSVNQTPPSIPTGESMTKDILNWVWENTLAYNTTFRENHNLSAVVGWTAQAESVDNSNMSATGFPNDLVETLNASTTATKWGTARENWSLLSALARVQYNYKNKYMLSATMRVDGSSRFGPSNRWGTFPSVSGGWYISEEDFMKGSSSWLSSLKLRASYGISGNFSIGNYEYYANLGDDNYILGTETLVPGLAPITAGNPELGWEKTAMTNLGLELGLFNMLTFELDIYNSNTSDMLLNVPLPEFSGFSTIRKNVGKVNNKGIEFSVSTNNTWGKFTWNNRLNFSLNRNKVVDLGGVDQIISQGETMEFITKVGEPIGNYYGLITNGVFMNQAEVDIANDLNDKRIAQVKNAKPGDFKFVDVDGSGVIDGNDKTMIGNYMPKFTYGYSTDLKYRWFDLSIALQGVYGNEVANINRRYLNNMEGGGNQIDALNRWQSEDNPGNGKVVRANRSATGMNGQMSTWHVENGSYLRVRNITFGVTIPSSWMKSIGLTFARFYFSTQNPFTFTKYSGYNPEVDMKGDPLTPGIDYGTYPLARSAVFGLNLTF